MPISVIDRQNGIASRFQENPPHRIVTQRSTKDTRVRNLPRSRSFRGILGVSPRDQLIISNAHPRSTGLKSVFEVLGVSARVFGRKPTDPRIQRLIGTLGESRSERERQKERRSGWRRGRIGAQRTSPLRQSGCLGIAKASFANTEAGRTRFRAEEGKEEEVESRSLRGKFEIQKRREQNDENDLPALLSRLERSLVSRAVHLRSTNLSIVSRQISGNITDMFRHEPSSSLSLSLRSSSSFW